MTLKSEAFLQKVIDSIITYQSEELLSDRELSEKAGLSPSMVSKIKNRKTVPKMSTIRKLRDVGVPVGSVSTRVKRELKDENKVEKLEETFTDQVGANSNKS